MAGPFTHSKIAILITGASRGLGRSIAVASLKHGISLGRIQQFHYVLLASTSAALSETCTLLRQISAEKRASIHLSIDVLGVNLLGDDLGPLSVALESPLWKTAEEHFLFNNAGILGNTGEITDSLRFKDYLAPMLVNAIAMGDVAGRFLESTNGQNVGERFVIHTSSKAGCEPVPTWAPYAMSKAAASMLHRTIAEECKDAQRRTRVLQWIPGPLTTDMTSATRANGEPPTTSLRWISPEESAEKLIAILCLDAYRSGDHTDFFDETTQVAVGLGQGPLEFARA